MSIFHCCPLVWNFSSAQILKKKVENLQIRELPFLLNYYGSFNENLLEKSGCPNMNLRRQRKVTLCVTGYMNESFKLTNIDNLIHGKYKPNLKIPNPNQVTLGRAIVQKYRMLGILA